MRTPSLLSLAALLFLVALPLPTLAQTLDVGVAAGGFAGPLGVQHDETRPWIWVSQAGTGNDDGAIRVVTSSGTFPFATGFRSVTAGDETQGLTQIRLDGTTLWVGQGLTSIGESYLYAFDTAGFTPGDPPLAPGDADLTVDVATFVLGHGFAESNPYDFVVSADGETVTFTDAAANALLALDVSSQALSVVATFPDIPNPGAGPPFIQPVPTGLVERNGDFYVGALTGFPFLPGLARVYRVRNGNVTVWRDELTSVTDVAVDPEDGQIVALEFAEFELASGFLPGTGRLVKLYDNGTRQPLASGLDLTPGVDIRGDDHAVTSLFGLLLTGDPIVDLDVSPDEITVAGPASVSVNVDNHTDDAVDLTLKLRRVVGAQLQTVATRSVSLLPGESFDQTFTVPVGAGDRYRLAFTAEATTGLLLDSDVIFVDAQPERAATASATTATARLTVAPNPFAEAATLTVALAEAAPVRLAVYDLLGREVAVLVDALLDTGTHSVHLDGAGLPAGVYLARLATGETTETLRLTLAR